MWSLDNSIWMGSAELFLTECLAYILMMVAFLSSLFKVVNLHNSVKHCLFLLKIISFHDWSSKNLLPQN